MNMGNGRSNHPYSNYWSPNSREKVLECCKCSTAVDGVEWVAHVFNGNPKKTYIFYSFTKEPCSMSVRAGADLKSLTGSVTRTFREGTPMIKMLRREGGNYMCVSCFEKCHQEVFQSVALSIHGKAALVNSEYTLNRASYGNAKK